MADIAEAAEVPGDGEASDCGRAGDIPETGSAFEEGQSPLVGFFLDSHPPRSPFANGGPPLICELGAEIVDVDEDEDAMEEDEFVRCALFRGMNILETSSALMEFSPP